MQEVLSFLEGSAYLYTGNASAIAAYVRNASVQMVVGRVSYRAPHATTWTYIETGREARLTIAQAWHTGIWPKLAYAASGGSVKLHLKHVTPGVTNSGGIWLYTGEIQTMSVGGQEGQPEQSLGIQGTFKDWSAY